MLMLRIVFSWPQVICYVTRNLKPQLVQMPYILRLPDPYCMRRGGRHSGHCYVNAFLLRVKNGGKPHVMFVDCLYYIRNMCHYAPRVFYCRILFIHINKAYQTLGFLAEKNLIEDLKAFSYSLKFCYPKLQQFLTTSYILLFRGFGFSCYHITLS